MLKTGMQRLTEDLEKNLPRPKSPHMDNEEPIELAHYPAAYVPDPQIVSVDNIFGEAKIRILKTLRFEFTKKFG